jgi:hypothetical protein
MVPLPLPIAIWPVNTSVERPAHNTTSPFWKLMLSAALLSISRMLPSPSVMPAAAITVLAPVNCVLPDTETAVPWSLPTLTFKWLTALRSASKPISADLAPMIATSPAPASTVPLNVTRFASSAMRPISASSCAPGCTVTTPFAPPKLTYDAVLDRNAAPLVTSVSKSSVVAVDSSSPPTSNTPVLPTVMPFGLSSHKLPFACTRPLMAEAVPPVTRLTKM